VFKLTIFSVDPVPVLTSIDLALEHSLINPSNVAESAASIDEKRQRASQTKKSTKMRPNASITARYECIHKLIAVSHSPIEISVHKIGVRLTPMELQLNSNTIMTTKSLSHLKRFASNIKWDLCLCFLARCTNNARRRLRLSGAKPFEGMPYLPSTLAPFSCIDYILQISG
jgi:hypothetical protein